MRRRVEVTQRLGGRVPKPIVRFRDLSVRDSERAEILGALDDLMRRGVFILGEDVEAFEAEFASRCGRLHGVGVANGTSALHLALRVLGVGPGDEVVTSPMSWVATTNAIVALGATPVFADVGADYTLDPREIRSALSERTKAIVPVHFYGLMASMPDIMELATDRGIPVVEDAAQAHGAEIEGRPAGSFGHLAAFSLNPMKPLAALGEAGAVVTDRPDWAERLRSLRNLGTVHPETCVEPSLNHKIDALQAVVLRTRMKHTADMVAVRNDIARRYSEALEGVVSIPLVPEGATSAFFDYTIHCSDRDRLEEHLLRGGIEVKVRHRMLLPDQPAYEGLCRCSPAGVPMARHLVGGILSLPIHEALTPGQVDSVIEAVLGFYRP